jgi:hypothetical protein
VRIGLVVNFPHTWPRIFRFSDLQSFKDYVVFVQTYLPDRFRPREGVGPDEQWTLELAFKGLRLGMRMAAEEKGEQGAIAQGRALIEEAYGAYQDGRACDGFFELEKLQKVLTAVKSVRSR